ncbi:multinuclear nonheme iron-dependent oxidase [Streptomyces sp. NPDC055287]
MERLGTGIGWRPEIAEAVEGLPGIDWVEAVAENLCPGHLPDSLLRLRARGTKVIPHGVSLGLGGADRPDPARLADLAARAEALGSPLVTEHIAFVRAGGPLTASPRLEAGHLLPVPRTWDALDVLCENVRIAQDSLPVPLALENIAALINWPDEDMTEGQFLAELVDRTGVRLLIDVANLHTNHVNRGEDPSAALDELPVEAIAYVHVAGGIEKGGVWHDTHAHPVTRPVLDILTDLRSRTDPPGVLLERDDNFPPAEELARELAAIRAAVTLPARPAAGPRAPRPAAAAAPRRGEAHAEPGPARYAGSPVPVPALTASPRGEAGTPARPVAATPPRGAHRPAAGPVAAGPVAGRTAGAGTGQGNNARTRVAVGQTALLSALVAGTPVPGGFDSARLRVQSGALAGKRADVVAKVAPELPEILGAAYRDEFLRYAKSRPMTAGYRRDALDFAEQLLATGRPGDEAARRRLTHWWQDRAAPHPPRRTTRFVRAARAALVRK